MPDITAIHGDITQQDVDAIVNAANNAMRGGGGVDGAIHRAGGPAILRECVEKFPQGLATGDAGWTTAGDLRARWVIHTVGPNYAAGQRDPSLLKSCYRRALEVADQLGARSVAFPLVSTGVYGWPLNEAIDLAIEAIAAADTRVEVVKLVAFDGQAFEGLRSRLAASTSARTQRDTELGSRAGSAFGHYRLRRLLGRGGFGEVYEADDTVMDRVVALKLLAPAYSRNELFRLRLTREARAAGRLHEPHVVPIHQCGEIDGQLYIDMRLIPGTDLQTVLANEKHLNPARAVAIVRQIAAALDAAHDVQMVHRDVKPANILLTNDDFACLVDFGLANAATDAKLTTSGMTIGTFAYMAPERLRGTKVTGRADVYALACVLYECLTGSPPFGAGDVPALITSHLNAPIPKVNQHHRLIPTAFDDVIARGLAKEQADRYGSAGELARAAHRALTASGRDQADTILAGTQLAANPDERKDHRRVPTKPATALVTAEPPKAEPTEESPWAVDLTDAGHSRSRWAMLIGGMTLVLLLAVAAFVTRPWQRHDDTPNSSPGASPATSSLAAPSITFDAMRNFVQSYYAELPSQPEKAWAMLDAHYQAKTGLREYLDFWATIRSVTVTSVSPRDASSVVAHLNYVGGDGQSNTEDRWFEMVAVNGKMLMDDSDVVTNNSPSATAPQPSAAPLTTVLPCNASNAAKLGYDSDTGKPEVCVNQALTPTDPPTWEWAEPPPMTAGVHETGASCDVRTDNMSRSSDGYLISCVAIHRGDPYGGYWEHYLGPIE